jgi:hypothetical protein
MAALSTGKAADVLNARRGRDTKRQAVEACASCSGPV